VAHRRRRAHLIHDYVLQSNCTYSYRVRFVNADSIWTGYSPLRTATTPPATPAVPASFGGTADSTTSVVWTWANVWGRTARPPQQHQRNTPGYRRGRRAQGPGKRIVGEHRVYPSRACDERGERNSAGRTRSRNIPRSTLPRLDITLSAVSPTQTNVTITAPPTGRPALPAATIDVSTNKVDWVQIKPQNNTYTYSHVGLTPGAPTTTMHPLERRQRVSPKFHRMSA